MSLTFAQAPCVVVVTATWCGHCIALKKNKVLEQLGAVLAADNVAVVLADSDLHAKVATALGITSYPSILFIDKSQGKHTYEGKRTVAAMAQWARAMNRRLTPQQMPPR